MFSQLKRVDNESGVVLFIVLMTAVVIMIFALGILTQSMNETNYAQQQSDQQICDQLTKGAFWNAYSSAYFDSGMQNIGISTVIQGRTYQISVNTTGTAQQYSITCNYDTFQ